MRSLMRHFRGASFGSWVRRITIIAFIGLFAAATPNLLAPEPQAQAVPGGEPVDFSSNVSSPSNNYAWAPDAPALRMGTTATVEGWINPTSCSSGSCTWVGKVNNFLFRVNSNGTHGWAMMGTNLQWWWNDTNIRARMNEWQHVAWVKNGTILTLFVDGQQVYTINNASSVPNVLNAGTDFSIHNRRDSLTEGFVGRVDEVRVWNTARTQAEIQSQMHTRASGAGLAAYYDFNDAQSGSVENMAAGAAAGTNLRVLGSLGATDVKQVLNPTGGNYLTTFVFPRTYITRDGAWRGRAPRR